jgi:hypothetical protein
MIGMRFSAIAAALLVTSALALADVTRCACDISNPETLGARECGLCKEAETQPVDGPVFLLKDNNPRKPNRWLALPRTHGKGGHAFADMTAAERLQLWNAAIAKGQEVWGDKWGIAYNGDLARTQCHGHVHIGKLLEGIETENFVVVNGPAQIPAPKDGTGIWVHPIPGGKLHVHLNEQVCETVLLR